MHPSMNRPHNHNGRNTFKAAAKLIAICLIAIAVPLALYVQVKSKSAPASLIGALLDTSTKRTKNEVTVHAAGRGKPFLNLQDGHGKVVTYQGDQAAVAALQSGAAQPRALASADFDHNGTPDVVAGYAFNGSGILTLQRGRRVRTG